MSIYKYSMKKFFLHFRDRETEQHYKDYIFERTRWFCRISWVIVLVLGGSFAVLDRHVFGDNASLVLMVRAIVLSIALIFLIMALNPKCKKFMDKSSALLILIIGPFCTFLTVMHSPTTFSPYFVGLLFAFTGIFSTAGLGFRYSFFALLLNLPIFELAIHFYSSVPLSVFVLYNFFLISILLIFGFLSYYIEYISRKNFVVNSQLHTSLSQVKKLSGLLPICSSCKKVRDDKGYWEQIETYLKEHSEVAFTHGICPDCMEELYPGMNEKIKHRKSLSSE